MVESLREWLGPGLESLGDDMAQVRRMIECANGGGEMKDKPEEEEGERRLAGDSFVTVDQGLALENKVHELERQKNITESGNFLCTFKNITDERLKDLERQKSITDERLKDLERQKNVTDDRLRYLEDILSLLMKRGTGSTDSLHLVARAKEATDSPHRVERETVQTDSPQICGSASNVSIYSLRSWSADN